MKTNSSVDDPEPLCPAIEGSFAYHTIQCRFPEIVTKVVDTFHRLWSHFDQTGDVEAKQVLHDLSEMRYQLMTNKGIQPLEVTNAPDHETWTQAIEEETKRIAPTELTWFNGSWLFVECYGYRRLVDIFMKSAKFSSFDPFFEQKCQTFSSNIESINRLIPLLDDTSVSFKFWFQLSLWGNRCDLSLKPTTPSYADIANDLKALKSKIIVNQLKSVSNHIKQLKAVSEANSITIDYVLDNAGFEWFTDCCLMYKLTDYFGDQLKEIRLHVKKYPWFVSDVTEKDFNWILSQLTEDQFSTLGTRWKNFVQNGRWKLVQSTYWTLPHDFSRMEKIDSEFYRLLEKSSLIIFKGDLNYRKLLGDLKWPYDTPFERVLRGFKPAFFVTLRTNKSDLICGMDPSVKSTLPADFLTTGEYAVVQVYDPSNK